MANKPCLPISRRRKLRGNDNDVDVNNFEDIATIDASEYLARVLQQSHRLPRILHHRNEKKESLPRKQPQSNKYENFVPIQGSAASLQYLVSHRTALVAPPTLTHLPSDTAQWVDTSLANFSQLRLYLDKLYHQHGAPRGRKQPVPGLKDRPGWHIFCVGKKEARGNVGSYFADDDEYDDDNEEEGEDGDSDNDEEGDGDSDKKDTDKKEPREGKGDDENPTTLLDWRHNLPEEGYTPTTSLILQLDQVMVRSVLAHLAYYVQEGWDPTTPNLTRWLYSLFARLEKPIHRNDAAVLFSLLRALTRARANFKVSDGNLINDKDREGLARLNVLLTIVGIYFEQAGGYAAVMSV